MSHELALALSGDVRFPSGTKRSMEEVLSRQAQLARQHIRRATQHALEHGGPALLGMPDEYESFLRPSLCALAARLVTILRHDDGAEPVDEAKLAHTLANPDIASLRTAVSRRLYVFEPQPTVVHTRQGDVAVGRSRSAERRASKGPKLEDDGVIRCRRCQGVGHKQKVCPSPAK